MRALILGVGDAFTKHHFGSSALVESKSGKRVLIDCPDPIHRVLHEAGAKAGWAIDAGAIDDIILTHLHGDHCNGVESLGFWGYMQRMQGLRRTPPRLHTTREVAARLWDRLAPAMDLLIGMERAVRLDDYFDLRIVEPGKEHEIAGLTVRCRFTTHHLPTIGLLLTEGRTTLGWSGDTRFERAHVDWLDEAGLIVHETNYPPAHTPIEDLNALPERIRKKIRLIHMGDDFDPKTTDMVPLTEGEVLEP